MCFICIFCCMSFNANRISNTIRIPDRLLQTWLTTTADIFDTLSSFPKDLRDIIKYTSDEIKEVFKNAVKKWKWYQRVWNTIISPFVAAWAIIEGAVRSVVTPTTNLVKNTYSTWRNFLSNTFKSTFWSVFSKKPLSDFKYESIKTANVIKKDNNFIFKWWSSRKVFKNTPRNTERPAEPERTPDPEPDYIDNYERRQRPGRPTRNTWNNPWNQPENVEWGAHHIWVERAKNILNDSPCWRIIIDRLCRDHPEFWIIFDNTTCDWRWNENNTITVWTLMPRGSAGMAPFNRVAKNREKQIKHILLHELAHCTLYSHTNEIPWLSEGYNIVKHYLEANAREWKTLSILSHSSVYETIDVKAMEDCVEMIALAMNGNWELANRYLKLLTDDEYSAFRANNRLVKISRADANKLRTALENVRTYYLNNP